MTEDIAPAAPSRPCEACIHFLHDGAHPLHARLCNRLDGRLLSADAERSLDGLSCSAVGREFVSAEGASTP